MMEEDEGFNWIMEKINKIPKREQMLIALSIGLLLLAVALALRMDRIATQCNEYVTIVNECKNQTRMFLGI